MVTGGGSGIGRATAEALAAEGARVLVADLDEAGAAETVRLIGEAGGEATAMRADVSREDDARAMVAAAEERYGGLDILHNNAGILGGGFIDTPVAEWFRTVQVNFVGVLLVAHAAIPALRRRGGGAIVNTASVAGLVAHPSTVYSATKFGVVGFTRSLARHTAPLNIRVNCVCPEVVDTPLIARARERARLANPNAPPRALAASMIPPEEVAAGVLQLIRDESLNGRALKISPGRPPELLEFPNWGVLR